MAVTDDAILRIKRMILSGELRPGDRLPPEKELSERLGLSRSSLREAVKALEMIRVLDARRGDGTYVTSLEPQLLLEAMSFVVELHDDSSVLHLFAIRRILEPAAASLAAIEITPAEIDELSGMIASVTAESTVEELVEHDLAFHRALVAAARNPYLSSLVEGVSGQTVRARVWRGLTQENAGHRTLSEHQSIVDALARGDADLARSLTTVHIYGVEQWLREAGVGAPAVAPVDPA